MTYVGIDVSKVTFVVAYSSVKTNKTRTFKNTVNGVHEFVKLFQHPNIIACWKLRAITARYSFTCFQRQALPSALKIR